jgi:hypothetical protein
MNDAAQEDCTSQHPGQYGMDGASQAAVQAKARKRKAAPHALEENLVAAHQHPVLASALAKSHC